jgi:type IV secretion/conjugal transfer VirB4 family ATPase
MKQFFKEFKDLRRQPDRRRGLPDLLNFGFPEDDQTIVMKDGARLRIFGCQGPDLNSGSDEELDAHREHANRALIRFDDEFAYQVDYIRYPSADRPQRLFPDPVSSMIDHEGALYYAHEDAHHESRTFLSIAWRPPSMAQTGLERAFVSGAVENERQRQRDYLNRQLTDLRSAMAPVWSSMEPLDLGGMLSFITTCINGRMSRIVPPRGSVPLDTILGNQDFIPGFKPRIGGRHIRVIALSGFPHHSHAELTTFLAELPFPYRFSIRALPFDRRTSISALGIIRRNWFQKKKGPRALFSETIGSGNGTAFENQHAAEMAADADVAIAEAESGEVRYAYVTAKVIITADSGPEADAWAQTIFKVSQNAGFDPRIETGNAIEGWLGSIPIHGWYDVRKPPIHTRNVAHILPLTSVWPGLATNPCPYYPPETPALIYGATANGTPWRFNLHVSDVGHVLIVGPIGVGKSVCLLNIASNFRFVPNSQIYFFDKGKSAYVMTKALGGAHLDLGEDEVPLQPLARIDDPVDRMQTQDFLESSMEVHGVKLLPAQSKALHHALGLLAEVPAEHRTITNLITQVQDKDVRTALTPFSLAGPLGRFLDADHDVLLDRDFVTFEMEALMNMGPKVVIPVLTYLFHRIRQRLDGRPALINLDEARTMLIDPTFAGRLEQWLRDFRKLNAAVVMATQSLSEIANSPHRDIILESCPTKLYLPSPAAKNPQTRELYRKFGLTDRQIDIIAEAVPKRDYYYVSPLGQRLFQFGLGPAALAFIGAGSREDIAEARRLIAEDPEGWTVEWLRRRGLPEWSQYLAQSYPSSTVGQPSIIQPYANGATA